jgi:hypothetical protein
MLERVTEFRERGYTVARGFFGKAETSRLLAEVQRLSKAPGRQSSLSDGGLSFSHNLFKQSQPFRDSITQQKVIDFIAPIAGRDLWVRWDQAVTKSPGAGVFRWHQDNGYNNLRTEHFQLWIALTETRNQNGGLWLAPGSHRRGRLPHKRIPGTAGQVEVQAEIGPDPVCIDATVGDLILFSSLMLHRTGPNDADTDRVAYVAEFMPHRDYDFGIDGPYLIAATGGVSTPRFVNMQPGALSIRNQLLYLGPRAHRWISSARRAFEQVKRGRATDSDQSAAS